MGGHSVENLRHWCRQQWSRFNTPCVASDTVAPDTTITLTKSTSHSSAQSLSLPQPQGPESACCDAHTHKCKAPHKPNYKRRSKSEQEVEFFTEYGDATRYMLQEVIGRGSYGVVCSAIDTHTGERVAIKKITNIFQHVSDALRILREIKLLRILRHPDIVELKHIMLPPSRKHFKDIYVVFELMESDLHEVIKVNRDLTREHCRFFLYQLLRALKFIHQANVFHRDLKPKNVLANADCKLKICDFGLARVAFDDAPSAIFWTDYVATRWYRAPELCGSFFSQYTPAVDIWSIGCIFAEVLLGKPLFPGKNVIHQLDLITDLLGIPPPEAVAKISNDKARCFLTGMPQKLPVPFSSKFPDADAAALTLLHKILAFDPKDRPTAEEALSDPYFKGMSKLEGELPAQPLTKAEFDFERRKMSKEDVKEHIYREILEYHPQVLKAYLLHGKGSGRFMCLSTGDNLNRQFVCFQEKCSMGTTSRPFEDARASISREEVLDFRQGGSKGDQELENSNQVKTKAFYGTHQRDRGAEEVTYPRRLFKSATVNGNYTGFAPNYVRRNPSLRSERDTVKQGYSIHELDKMQKKSHSLGFQVAKTIQAIRNSLTRS